MSKIDKFMTEWFGGNWETTVLGTISAVSFTISTQVELLNWIGDDSLISTIRGISGLIAAVTAILFSKIVINQKLESNKEEIKEEIKDETKLQKKQTERIKD